MGDCLFVFCFVFILHCTLRRSSFLAIKKEPIINSKKDVPSLNFKGFFRNDFFFQTSIGNFSFVYKVLSHIGKLLHFLSFFLSFFFFFYKCRRILIADGF